MSDEVTHGLRRCAGLTAEELALVAGLERRVLDADGGRLKLEWGTLRSRGGVVVEDLLWFDDGLLVGFAGLYSFGSYGMPVEVAGMVAPSHRRRGVAGSLLDGAAELVAGRGVDRLLLVTPRSAHGGGAAFAAARGGVLEHSEHALVLRGEPRPGPTDPLVSLRAATAADAPRIGELIAQGFGHPAGDVASQLSDAGERNVVVVRAGEIVGYVRLTLEEGTGGVYGFVIDASLRGQGLGRDVLRRGCVQLRADGATQVGLEVATDNEHALGLYTSLGFEPVSTEDYFTVGVGPAAPGPSR